MRVSGSIGKLSVGPRDVAELGDWTLQVDPHHALGVVRGAFAGTVRRWLGRPFLTTGPAHLYLTISEGVIWTWPALELAATDDAIRLQVESAPTIIVTRRN
jgi:hypothetical protein